MYVSSRRETKREKIEAKTKRLTVDEAKTARAIRPKEGDRDEEEE